MVEGLVLSQKYVHKLCIFWSENFSALSLETKLCFMFTLQFVGRLKLSLGMFMFSLRKKQLCDQNYQYSNCLIFMSDYLSLIGYRLSVIFTCFKASLSHIYCFFLININATSVLLKKE